MWSSWVQGNFKGPLVPMVQLVPIEKYAIPMVLLVNMHLIKSTEIIFSCDLAGYRVIPMVHCGIGTNRKAHHSNGSIGECAAHWGDLDYFPCDLAGYRAIPMVHQYQWCSCYQQKSRSFKWFYWWICISLTGLRLFSMWSNWVQGNSDGPLVLIVWLVPIEKDAIPMVLLVNMHLIKVT